MLTIEVSTAATSPIQSLAKDHTHNPLYNSLLQGNVGCAIERGRAPPPVDEALQATVGANPPWAAPPVVRVKEPCPWGFILTPSHQTTDD